MDALIVGLVSAIVGAAGSLYGVNMTLRRTQENTRANDRVKLTFDFFRQFNSEAMNLARNHADVLLQRYPAKTIYEIAEDPSIAVEDKNPIWTVSSFFCSLSLAVRFGQVDTHLVLDLLGPTFVWWYKVYFESRMSANGKWEDAEQIEELYDSLWRFARTSIPNKEKLERWETNALEEVETRKKNGFYTPPQIIRTGGNQRY